MRGHRILPLLGPLAVLYLVADVASGSDGLGTAGVTIAVVATLLGLTPYAVRQVGSARGARRVGALGVALGIFAVSAVRPDVPSLVVDLATGVSGAVAGALLLELGLGVPDAPRRLDRTGMVRLLPIVLSVLVAAVGVLALLPPFALVGIEVLVPASWQLAPEMWLLAAVGATFLLRAARRRLGSPPDALASNAWAQLGLAGAILAGVLAWALVAVGVLALSAPWTRALVAFAAVALVAGHVAMVDVRRRLSAGAATRRVVAAFATAVVVAAAAGSLAAHVPRDPVSLGICVLALLALTLVLYRVMRTVVRALLAPHGGRLLDAIEEAERVLGSATTYDDLARSVLPPLRAASGSLDAAPWLFTAEPGREIGIDAAGEPRVRARPMPEALAWRVADRPGEVVVRAALEGLVVRRPELRELVEVLVAHDALCAIPLAVSGEVEGAVVVPRGRRRAGLALEEIARLESLGDRLSGTVAVLSAQQRAQARAGRGDVHRKDLEEEVADLRDQVRRLRADTRVLSTGPAADRMTEPPIAYGPAMKNLLERVDRVASMEAPMLLVAEAGTATDKLCHRIHAGSGRSSRAFVIADCAAVRPERAAATLFGEDGDDGSQVPRPGWLRLAAGGSLILTDVAALPLPVQRELAEALAERSGRAVDGAGAYEVDVRVMATSRLPLDPLVEAGAFDAELARWLSAVTLEVPSLRERREDLASIVLLALDRACRVLGRDPVGIEQDALDALLAHDWPGNVRELSWVIDTAVSVATGPKVTRDDLPALGSRRPAEPVADPFEGTWAELERRILVHALERADGNKSEAARALGLKRTTFLDKLRRHNLKGTSQRPPAAADRPRARGSLS